MGTTLTGKRVQNTYDSLLKLSDNDNLTSTAKIVGDGLGNDSPIYLSTTQIGIGVTPSFQFHVDSHAKIGGNLIVGGNLTVNGTTTHVDSTIVEIGDNMIELAAENVSNTKDIGWYGTINSSGEKYVGVFYDASSGVTVPTFRIGLGTVEPDSTAAWTVKGKIVIGALDATSGVFSSNVDIDGYLQVDGAIKDSDGDAGTSGQVLSSTGSGTNWVDFEADTAKALEIDVKNVFGATMTKGTVVHAQPTGTLSGNVIEVVKADANVAANMPAIGILNEDLVDDAEGKAVMFGTVQGIDTSSFSVGDELYVSTTAGLLTATKHTSTSALLQKVAIVVKSHATNGLIKVFGAGRVNDVPNEVDRDLSIAGTLKVDDLIEIEADSGYGRLEIGGPSGGYIDLKTPFSDDYDLRIITDTTESQFTGAGTFKINAGNTLTLTLDGTTQNATFAKDIITTDGILNLDIGTTNIGIEVNSDDAGSYIRFNDGVAANRWYAGVNSGDFRVYNNSNEAPFEIDSNNDSTFTGLITGSKSAAQQLDLRRGSSGTDANTAISFTQPLGTGYFGVDLNGALSFNIAANLITSKFKVDRSGNGYFSGDLEVGERIQVGTNTSSDSSIISQTGDIQLRIGSNALQHSPYIRFQGNDGTNSVYGDVKLDVTNQKLVFNDPGTTGGTTGQKPMTLDNGGNLVVQGNVTISDDSTLIIPSHSGFEIEITGTHAANFKSNAQFYLLSQTGSIHLGSGGTNSRLEINTSGDAIFSGDIYGNLIELQGYGFKGGEGDLLDSSTFGKSGIGNTFRWVEQNSASSGSTWRKVCDVTLNTTFFDGVQMEVVVYQPNTNWGNSASFIKNYYSVAFRGSQSDVGPFHEDAIVYGINADLLRVYKVSTNNYELQARSSDDNRDLVVEYTITSKNNAKVIPNDSYTAGTTSGGTAYTASANANTKTKFAGEVEFQGTTIGDDLRVNGFLFLGAGADTTYGGYLTNKGVSAEGISMKVHEDDGFDIYQVWGNAGESALSFEAVDSQVKLYYSGSEKLKTISDGVQVTDHLLINTSSTQPLTNIFDGTLVIEGGSNEDPIIAITDSGTNNAFAILAHQSSTSAGVPSLRVQTATTGTGSHIFEVKHGVSNTTGAGGATVLAVDTLGLTEIIGTAKITGTADGLLTLDQDDTGNWSYINFQNQGTRKYYIGTDAELDFRLGADVANSKFQISNFSDVDFSVAKLHVLDLKVESGSSNSIRIGDGYGSGGSATIHNYQNDLYLQYNNNVSSTFVRFGGGGSATDIIDAQNDMYRINSTDTQNYFKRTTQFHSNVYVNQTGNLTSKALQVNGFIDITDVTSTALRWYNGTTFRGGLGLDSWAFGGSDNDMSMYIQGDNSFFVYTNNVARAEFKSGSIDFMNAVGTNPAQGSTTLFVRDTSSMAANVGGAIVFSGAYATDGTYLGMGPFIRGYKENSTSGNYSFGLKLGTRVNGAGSSSTAIQIEPSHNTTVYGALSLVTSTAKLTLDGSSYSGFNIYSPSNAHVNMDARNYGTDGAALHKYNRNSASNAYRAYYERWYDGDSYHDIGIEGDRFQMNTGLNIDGVTTIGKDSQSGNAQLTVKSTAGGNTGIILIEGDTTNDGWGVYATTANDYVITRFTNGSYSDKFVINSSGNLTFYGSLTVNSTGQFYSAIGTADDVRTGLAHYDTTSQAAGVGGQLVLGYKYIGDTTYTEGAILKMYKENSTSGHYGSGLKFQVRNNGASLSTKMTLNPSGQLGIGVLPSALLHLSSATPYIYIDDTSTSGTKTRFQLTVGDVGTTQSGTFSFNNTSGTSLIDVMTLNELGRVGLGISSPSNRLHTYSGDNEGIYMQGTGGGHWFNFKAGSSNLWSMGAQSGLMGWYNRTSPNVGYKMIIEDAGNVGINMTDSSYKLHVQGEAQIHSFNFETGTYPGIRFRNGYTSTTNIWKFGVATPDANALYLYDYTRNDWNYWFIPNSNMYFRPNGNIGIGYNNTSTLSYKLDLTGGSARLNGVRAGQDWHIANRGGIRIDSKGSSYPSDLLFGHTAAANQTSWTGVYWSISSRGSSSGGNNSLYFYRGGGNPTETSEHIVMAIHPLERVGINDSTPSYALDVTGDIRATADVIAFSDARVKENVETIDSALDKVNKLRGVKYNRNDIEDKSKKIGVIAQEVLEVLPEVVQLDDNDRYSVAYGNMAGLFIEAIKELKAEIEELKKCNCKCNCK